MPTKVTFKWSKPVKQIAEEATGGDKTALHAAQAWHRLYEPFVPRQTGSLSLTQVDHYVEDGKGIIHHKAPYAHYQYEGEVYVDPQTGAAGFLTSDGWFSRKGVKKEPSGRKLNYTQTDHPLATAHWDEAAKQAGKGEQLAREVEAFIKKGGGS